LQPWFFLLSKGQVYNFSEGSSITGFEISFDDFPDPKSPANIHLTEKQKLQSFDLQAFVFHIELGGELGNCLPLKPF